MSQSVLDELYQVIRSRKGGDPAKSYTARLFAKGVSGCAQKVGEEGVELALAAVSGAKGDITSESADLLYHMLVLWAACDVDPQTVYDELARRKGVSGLAEKAARKE